MISFNPQVVEPELKDLLDLLRKDIFLTMNCHALATVQSFNSTKQTVQATLNYSKTYYKKDPQTGQYTPYEVPYPVLLDVPVVIMGGSQWRLTFPIAAGDQCVILFNDRDMDNWAAGASSGPVATGRLHDLSDGIALVGISRGFSGYDTTHASLRSAAAQVSVGVQLIKIANNQQNLKTLLQDLITAIQALVVNPGSFNIGMVPVVGTGSVSNSDLATISTRIGQLLE